MSENETPSAALARLVAPLEPSRAAILRDSFGSMFDKVEAWHEEAAHLVVTSEDEKGKMQRARSLRLEIKNARVALDARRKELKAGILTEGRAIDGAYAVFVGLAEPLEKNLLEQEKFAERAEQARRDALRDARATALLALGTAPAALPAALGEMTEDAWAVVLADAQAAKDARDEKARIEEEARKEAARLEAEKAAERRNEAVRLEAERQAREAAQKAENERLRREAEEREAELAKARKVAEEERRAAAAIAQANEAARAMVQREADLAKLKAQEAEERERAALAEREKAVAEARRAREEADEAKAARPPPAPANTAVVVGPVTPGARTRVAIFLGALQRIASQSVEPKSAAVARQALADAGIHAPAPPPPSAIPTEPAPPADEDDPLGLVS